jgi:murein DD-endopeptidase / murein LD-carboxypeptidase
MTSVVHAVDIAARALAQIGTPFRHFGRTPHVALDCVGLPLLAIGSDDKGWRYSLKGDYCDTISAYFVTNGFIPANSMEPAAAGDIALVRCGPTNQHLMIRAREGWVHAHAGLCRVVHMPGQSAWPLMALWRLAGE